jgi:hypothetical protein
MMLFCVKRRAENRGAGFFLTEVKEFYSRFKIVAGTEKIASSPCYADLRFDNLQHRRGDVT